MRVLWWMLGFSFLLINSYSQEIMKEVELTSMERYVIEERGTEPPFSGVYVDFKEAGSYHCKRCGALLYRSEDKFDSHCGWPSFDDEVEGAVRRLPDEDGRRTEIRCAACDAHLGHLFLGERLTPKNVRHCVNSVSLNFVSLKENQTVKMERAIFASGCFWGTEYHMSRKKGVDATTVGYIGGKVKNPDYQMVCSGSTGHQEAVEVWFNPEEVSYRELLILFFETHDFTQTNGQGPDLGEQYLSRIFYVNDMQQQEAEKTIAYLQEVKGYKVATKVLPATEFYPAESYHQDYYTKKGSTPYCHAWRPIF
ncbi:MAG: peptide-methionine (S)-S-oxide reductase [Bacteroidetes bacterium]|nr:MAG: peptide-methionine (S)-S-oxide reductase [Bacteroidota bacterium]PIE87675.1 MAG: peptide-methionine (S)-S-oxide reductase [Bacteroidota bacterium]